MPEDNLNQELLPKQNPDNLNNELNQKSNLEDSFIKQIGSDAEKTDMFKNWKKNQDKNTLNQIFSSKESTDNFVKQFEKTYEELKSFGFIEAGIFTEALDLEIKIVEQKKLNEQLKANDEKLRVAADQLRNSDKKIIESVNKNQEIIDSAANSLRIINLHKSEINKVKQDYEVAPQPLNTQQKESIKKLNLTEDQFNDMIILKDHASEIIKDPNEAQEFAVNFNKVYKEIFPEQKNTMMAKKKLADIVEDKDNRDTLIKTDENQAFLQSKDYQNNIISNIETNQSDGKFSSFNINEDQFKKISMPENKGIKDNLIKLDSLGKQTVANAAERISRELAADFQIQFASKLLNDYFGISLNKFLLDKNGQTKLELSKNNVNFEAQIDENGIIKIADLSGEEGNYFEIPGYGSKELIQLGLTKTNDALSSSKRELPAKINSSDFVKNLEEEFSSKFNDIAKTQLENTISKSKGNSSMETLAIMFGRKAKQYTTVKQLEELYSNEQGAESEDIIKKQSFDKFIKDSVKDLTSNEIERFSSSLNMIKSHFSDIDNQKKLPMFAPIFDGKSETGNNKSNDFQDFLHNFSKPDISGHTIIDSELIVEFSTFLNHPEKKPENHKLQAILLKACEKDQCDKEMSRINDVEGAFENGTYEKTQKIPDFQIPESMKWVGEK